MKKILILLSILFLVMPSRVMAQGKSVTETPKPASTTKAVRYSLSSNANITQNGLKVSGNLPIEKKIEIFKENIKFIGSNNRKNNLYNDPNGKWTLTKNGAIFEINGVKQTISFNKDKVIVEQSVNGQTKKFGLKVVEPTVQAPTAKNLTTVEKEKTTDYIGEVLKLVNIERGKEGLKPLTLSKELTTVADTRSKEIIQLFDHARPNGGMFYDTLTREQKIKYFSLGENIASGQITPEEVVKDWMKSPGHRANIMRPDFNTLGLSIAYNDKTGEANWVQIFGKAKVVNPDDELVLKKVEPTPAVVSTPKPTAKPVVETTPTPDPTPTPEPVVHEENVKEDYSKTRVNNNETVTREEFTGTKEFEATHEGEKSSTGDWVESSELPVQEVVEVEVPQQQEPFVTYAEKKAKEVEEYVKQNGGEFIPSVESCKILDLGYSAELNMCVARLR